MRHDLLAAVHHPDEIDAHTRVPVFIPVVVGVDPARGAGDARIVDEDVDLTPRAHDLRNAECDRFPIRHVHVHAEPLHAEFRHLVGDSICRIDLGAYTDVSSVASVASRSQFTLAGLGAADARFTAGELVFTSGFDLYQDIRLAIRASVGDDITLATPLFADIPPGAELLITAGCTKRRDEDCVAIFDNVLNFGGPFVDAPTLGEQAGEDA